MNRLLASAVLACVASVQVSGHAHADNSVIIVPRMLSGTMDEANSTNSTATSTCSDGKLIPAPMPGMSEHISRLMYLFGLLWCFVGVAIVADTFMAAIETITSTQKVVTYKGKEFHVKVWNDTVANLTLMALGSSAPEILLSVIEILLNDMLAGALGPSTIVGSAAFNLMCISAVCVVAIPTGELRRVKDMNVFAITGICSVFAYLWLIIILTVWTPNVVTVPEAVLTFLFFPILVCSAYGADKKWVWCKSKKRVTPKVSMDAVGGVSKEETAAVMKKVHDEFGEDLSPEDMARYAHFIKVRDAPKSRAARRVEATRCMFGGKKTMNATPPAPLSMSSSPGIIQFVHPAESCAENAGSITLGVQRSKPWDREVEVHYATQDLLASNGLSAATANKDYVAAKGVLKFAAGSGDAEIIIEVIDDEKVEGDESFEVVLTKPSSGSVGAQGKCTVTILNDDIPGVFAFDATAYRVKESDGEVKVCVLRRDGVAGNVSCKYMTVDETAVAPADYTHTEGVLEFAAGETRKEFSIPIMQNDEEWERDEKLQVHLHSATGGASFSEDTDGHSKKEIVTVTIVSCDKIKGVSNALNAVMRVNSDKLRIGTSNWSEQFKNAFDARGGDADADLNCMAYFGHFVALPFKVLFALIPPTDFAGGWACFVVSLIFIAIVTTVIGDLASLLGCVFGMKDMITAITFVALGTSLPDTLASKAAAVGDEHADNSLGNVTGSNSVNVFLGLGLPWLIAAAYWTAQDCGSTGVNSDACVIWFKTNADWLDLDVAASASQPAGNADVKQHGFVVHAGDLATGVVVFSSCAVVTLVTLYARRLMVGGELGGPESTKKATGVFFIGLWFLYLAISIAVIEGHVDPI